MKKEIIMILLLGIILMPAKAVTADKSPLIGSWQCTASDVPEEYRTSTIIITEKEGKLAGEVKFTNGMAVALNYVKQSGNDVSMSVYVEGYEVIIKGKLAGSKMTGTADTPDGQVSLTATKIEKKK